MGYMVLIKGAEEDSELGGIINPMFALTSADWCYYSIFYRPRGEECRVKGRRNDQTGQDHGPQHGRPARP